MPDKKLTDVPENNVGKMTDTEIKKALECCNDCNCCGCPCLTEYGCKEIDYSVIIDLINRLQAENKRLSTLAKLGNTRANDYRVMRDRALKAEAEIKDLQKVIVDDFASEYDNKIKAEAYKECIEKVKENSNKTELVCSGALVSTDYTITEEALDNLLKELVGDDE